MGCARHSKASNHGFTILELLVVLLLLGIIVSMATLAVGDGADRKLRSETERLVGMLRLVRDEQMITGGGERALGLRPDGYSLLELVILDDATREWQPVQDQQLQPRVFEQGLLEVVLEQEGRRRPLSQTGSWEPLIRLGNTGEMTPSQIILQVPGRDLRQVIDISLDGQVEVINAAQR
ncbi:MAG: prepilin-type N-terminal cleavage/methylation domain-containing protein [Gammaproteobacteria bacterium]|nr:prepilin-type N-terminal cleavage/methylation domain-containing protein [Gammaproteobacteria bacterium]